MENEDIKTGEVLDNLCIEDLLIKRNYQSGKWEVVRQISYDEDDFVIIGDNFETTKDCMKFIDMIGKTLKTTQN